METKRGLESSRKGNGVLILQLIWLLLYCRIVAAQSAAVGEATLEQGMNTMTCGEVCHYDDWFQRARCEERNLYHVPSSDGCENSIMLELQGNHLRNISTESLLGYSHVKTLDLSANEITVVYPGTFSNMICLKHILINDNYLCELRNATFAGTENTLKHIYLNENALVKLEEGIFRGLSKVVALNLSNNKIRDLPRALFHGLYELKYLKLGMNKLENLHEITFKNLTRLKHLHLENNKLTWLPPRLFHGHNSLMKVVLSNNALVMVHTPENLGITSLDNFYLDDNNLTLSSSIIPYLNVTHERLDVTDNPFTCDCAFKFIQGWYHNSSQENFLGHPVTCTLNDIRYNINDPIPFMCEISETATQLSTKSTKDSQTETTTQPSNDMTSSPAYSFETEQCPFYNNEGCSHQNKYDIIGLVASVYSAVVLTIFIVVQMSFNIYFFRRLYFKEKSYTVTGVTQPTEE